jgi:hypothetical protein
VGPEKGSFNPILITLLPSPSEPAERFSASVKPFDVQSPGFGTIDSALTVQRIWDISETTRGGNHVNLTFAWVPQEDGAAVQRILTDPVSVGVYILDSASQHYELVDSAVGPAPGPGTIVASTEGFIATSFGSYVISEDARATSVSDQQGGPLTFALEQNYPNPFNPATTIGFRIGKTESVSLVVYDLLGREVATLVDEVRPRGSYVEQFNGSHLASGVYMYRLTTPSQSATKRLVLVK